MCLSGLGVALLNDRKFQEAEIINYICLQLNHEPLNHANPLQGRFFSMGVLAGSLAPQQKFEDCASVLSVAESLFGAWFRFNDHHCCRYYIVKAKVLKYLGRLLECEDILRSILSHTPDHPDPDMLSAMAYLISLLMETNRLPEAVIWQEEKSLMDAEIYGIGHRFSQINCENLGFSYANLGRYEDAIVHFRQTAGKMALSQTEDAESRNDYIEKIRSWISEVEEMKVEQEKTVELQRIVERMPPDSSAMYHLMILMDDQYSDS
jgi:tetratricopeptide (TPR) repeat protein